MGSHHWISLRESISSLAAAELLQVQIINDRYAVEITFSFQLTRQDILVYRVIWNLFAVPADNEALIKKKQIFDEN